MAAQAFRYSNSRGVYRGGSRLASDRSWTTTLDHAGNNANSRGRDPYAGNHLFFLPVYRRVYFPCTYRNFYAVPTDKDGRETIRYSVLIAHIKLILCST